MSHATILVVDDEPLIRWSLSERLRADGHEVLEAEDGATALARARDGVDLVLLDYKLPDIDGLTILRRLKELDPDTLVIMLSAHAGTDTAVTALELGASHFASKPFDLDAVAALVTQALDTSSLHRAAQPATSRPHAIAKAATARQSRS